MIQAFLVLGFAFCLNANASDTCTVPAGLPRGCQIAFADYCDDVKKCGDDKLCIAEVPPVPDAMCFENTKPDPVRPVVKFDPPKPNPNPPPVVNPNPPSPTPVTPVQENPACQTSLASARRACDASQARSFSRQVSPGSGGITDTTVANSGVQNVNNVILNCNNTQNQCLTDCSGNSAATNECNSLASNLRVLANEAKNSFDDASDSLASGSHYVPLAAANTPQGEQYPKGPVPGPVAPPNNNSNYAAINKANSAQPNAGGGSGGSFSQPSSASQEFSETGGLNSQLMADLAPSTAGTLPSAAAVVPNNGAPPQFGGDTGKFNGTAAPVGLHAAQNQRQASAYNIGSIAPAPGGGGGGSGFSAAQNDYGFNAYGAFNTKNKNGEILFEKNFSLLAYLNERFNDTWAKFTGKQNKRKPASQQNKNRLGNDRELAMIEMANSKKGIPDSAFAMVILSLSAAGLWHWSNLLKLRKALSQAKLAEQAQRRINERRAQQPVEDRRVQSSLFREGEAERRQAPATDRRDKERERRKQRVPA